MTRIVARIPAFATSMLLSLLAPAADAQTRLQEFHIAAGVQYGLQDPERAVTPGWVVSSDFDLGGQTFVVEGAWHRDAYAQEHPWNSDEVLRQTHLSRYWTLTGGVRGGWGRGRVVPYYQVLAGGFAGRFRTDFEWPASIDVEAENASCGIYVGDELVEPCRYVPYPEFDEERATAFVMQPGMGLEVHVWRGLAVRLAADVPIFAGRDYVVLRPRLSGRVVVAFGP